MKEKDESINLILSILAILIPTIIFFISSPEKITPSVIIIFVGIGGIILIITALTQVSLKWKDINQKINKNNYELEEMKKSLKDKEVYTNMDVRISVLEKIVERLWKNKKGGIDPKIIGWVLVGILLYLFLKSIGIFS